MDGTIFDVVLGFSSSDSVLAFLVVYGRERDFVDQIIYKFFGEPGVLFAKRPASGVIEGALFVNIRLPKVLFEESVLFFVVPFLPLYYASMVIRTVTNIKY